MSRKVVWKVRDEKFFRRNADDNIPFGEKLPDPVAVIAPITDELPLFFHQVLQKDIRSFEIADLLRGQMKADKSDLDCYTWFELKVQTTFYPPDMARKNLVLSKEAPQPYAL